LRKGNIEGRLGKELILRFNMHIVRFFALGTKEFSYRIKKGNSFYEPVPVHLIMKRCPTLRAIIVICGIRFWTQFL
jgi:hypothetical protein